MGVGHRVHVCQTDPRLYQDWFILWLKKGSQRHVKIFLSPPFGCLICVVTVLFHPVDLYGESIRWGGHFSLSFLQLLDSSST